MLKLSLLVIHIRLKKDLHVRLDAYVIRYIWIFSEYLQGGNRNIHNCTVSSESWTNEPIKPVDTTIIKVYTSPTSFQCFNELSRPFIFCFAVSVARPASSGRPRHWPRRAPPDAWDGRDNSHSCTQNTSWPIALAITLLPVHPPSTPPETASS